MSEHWFVLNLNPEPWAIGPVGYRRSGGKMSAYVGRNQQLDAYKEAVREALGPQEKIQGKVDLKFFFWRNRAEYTTPQARSHRKHEADMTNLQKATEDALQGVLFDNDRDVLHCESFLVAQGPDITGQIIINAQETDAEATALLARSLIPADIQHIASLMERDQNVDDNSWPPRSP